MSYQYSSSILKQPMNPRTYGYSKSIKNLNRFRGAKAIPIELEEPDEIDRAEAWDLEQEYQLDMADYYVDDTWEKTIKDLHEYQDMEYLQQEWMQDNQDLYEDDTDWGYLQYMNPELS